MQVKHLIDWKGVSDWFYNKYLSLAGYSRAVLGEYGLPVPEISDNPKYNRMPDYKTNFSDLDGWSKGLWWGDFHPDEKKYTKDSNVLTDTGGVFLNTKRDPWVHEGKIYTYSCAAIQSERRFGYGYYSVAYWVEQGSHLWHAPLWFISWENDHFVPVTPEMDALEVYSDAKGNFKSESNVHFGKDYSQKYKRSLGAIKHYAPSGGSYINRIGMEYAKDSIKVYMNGYLVRRITSDRVMSMFRYDLVPIISSGVLPEKEVDEEAGIEVYEFNYWKE